MIGIHTPNYNLNSSNNQSRSFIQLTNMQETYTIIQRNEYDSWRVIDVAHNLKDAQHLCAWHCNAAGVARTLVLNSMGQTVCVES